MTLTKQFSLLSKYRRLSIVTWYVVTNVLQYEIKIQVESLEHNRKDQPENITLDILLLA